MSGWTMLLLKAANVIMSVTETIQFAYTKVSRAFDTIFLPTFYVFFKGIRVPYLAHQLHLWASGSAKPEFIYDADTQTFFPACGLTYHEIKTEGRQQCVPYLSMEVIDETDTVQYDLTDFLEKCRFYTFEGDALTPTVYQLLSAWSIGSYIVPDPSRFRLRTIDLMGETHTVRLVPSEEESGLATSDTESDATIKTVTAVPAADAAAETT